MPAMDFTSARKYRFKKGDLFLGLSPLRRREIGMKTDRHAITIAGARSGKGAGLIIPNLLRWPHNALVIDPKGEAAQATARKRRKLFGQSVHVLDPFGVSGIKSASFNPLAAIDPNSPHAREDVKVLADGLVMRHDPTAAIWDDGALDVIAGVMAYVLTHEPLERRSLIRVRELLASSDIGAVADKMDGNPALGNLMTGAAGRLLRTGKESTHYLSGANANTAWLDSPTMKDVLSRSTFDLADIRGKKCTVFLVLPSHLLAEHGRFLRLFVRASLNAMAKGGVTGGRKCLFILDEFYSLGKLDEIAKAAGLMPGYGVHLWPFLQDLGQLEDLYGRDAASTFFGNADAHVFFGNTDAPTLDYISRQMGIRQEAGLFDTDKELVGKPYMTPREIRAHVAKKINGVVARRMVVFAKGSDILSLRLAPYFQGKKTVIQTIMHIAWGAVLIALGFMGWVYIGGENLGAYWEWQWRPYVEFWNNYDISGFFRHEGAPYLTLLYVVAAIFAALLLRRILTFAAKVVLSFTIAQTALYALGAEGIWQPAPALYVASGVAVAWLIASIFIEKMNIGQSLRGLFRRLKS